MASHAVAIHEAAHVVAAKHCNLRVLRAEVGYFDGNTALEAFTPLRMSLLGLDKPPVPNWQIFTLAAGNVAQNIINSRPPCSLAHAWHSNGKSGDLDLARKFAATAAERFTCGWTPEQIIVDSAKRAFIFLAQPANWQKVCRIAHRLERAGELDEAALDRLYRGAP